MLSTVVDNGRLHVAFNEHYQGNVNAYNNFITRFFSKLFSSSIDVQIDGMTRCLNKKSYINFLTHLGVQEASLKTDDQLQKFDSSSCNFVNNRGLMRDHLTTSKVNELGCDLMRALHSQDMQQATKLLGKGAEVNQLVWIRDYPNPLVFGSHFTTDLPHQRILPFKATRYTPFLLAIAKKQDAFSELLVRFGANSLVKGETCLFNRSIVNINNYSTIEPTIRSHLVITNHRHCNPHRGDFPRRYDYVHTPGLNWVQNQTVTFEDHYDERAVIHFDEKTRGLNATNLPSEKTQWNDSSRIGRISLV